MLQCVRARSMYGKQIGEPSGAGIADLIMLQLESHLSTQQCILATAPCVSIGTSNSSVCRVRVHVRLCPYMRMYACMHACVRVCEVHVCVSVHTMLALARHSCAMCAAPQLPM